MRPTATGLINAIGGLGSFVGPTVIGYLLTANYLFAVGVAFCSISFLLASAIAFGLRRHLATS